jgi:hypothetical protein
MMGQELYLSANGTTLTVKAATEREQRYCFSDEQAPHEKAVLGHLRIDYGSSGKQFYTTWWPHQAELKTDAFVAEFDNVVNALKKTELMGNFENMRRACYHYPEARIRFQFGEEYAFRADTKDYTYFLRCIPRKGDYNHYLVAYNAKLLKKIQGREHGVSEKIKPKSHGQER